jgi:hypothetical protein
MHRRREEGEIADRILAEIRHPDGGFSIVVEEFWFALDSSLEGDGFELSVPRDS